MKQCHVERYSKVKWDEINGKFDLVTMEVGEHHNFYFLADSCSISRSEMIIKGRIIEDSLNPTSTITSTVFILSCNADGYITDTLLKPNNKSFIKINVSKINTDYIVFKETNEKFGLKYRLRYFK